MITQYTFIPPTAEELRGIASTPEMGAAMEEYAEIGKAYAESIAPVLSGEYKGSFRVERVDGPEGAGAELVNDAEHAAFVEFGTEDTEAHHVLAQAADFIEGGA